MSIFKSIVPRSLLSSLLTTLALVFAAHGISNAAHFEKFHEQIDQQANQPIGGEANPAPAPPHDPCLTIADSNADASVGGGQGDVAFVLAYAEASVVGELESCELNADASAVATAEVRLDLLINPDPDEEVGEEIVLCYRTQNNLSASASGPSYQASSEVLSLGLLDDEIVLSSAPTVSDLDEEDVQQSSSLEVIAQIGNTVSLAAVSVSTAAGVGIGDALSTALSRVEVTIGSCSKPQPIPTLSGAGLGLLALLLLGIAATRRFY